MPDPINWGLALPFLLGAFAFGYLLGSIPFGLLLTRAAGLGDVRAIGSGNIGATNVLRTGNRSLAAATLVADLAKGFIAVLAAASYGPDLAVMAGLGAFVGQCCPVWLRFRGGKGVATYIGVLAGLAWPMAVGFCAIWLLVAAIFRYSSLAALIASIATVIGLRVFNYPQQSELFALLTIILWLKHWANIRRLLRGEEGRIKLGGGG